MMRLSLFQQEIADALISQSAPLRAGSTTLFTYVLNVDRERTRGVDLVASRLTYADGRVLENPVFLASVNKVLPQIPKWRANALAIYRLDERLSFTLGAR